MKQFDERAIRNAFMSDIKAIFDNANNTIKESVSVLSSNYQPATFPCCVVKILNPVSDTKYDDTNGTYRKIRLSLSCDLYSKELDDYSLEDSVIILSQILIKGFIQKYGTFTVTRNNDVPYRSDVARRNVVFICTYDVEENIIYSN